MVKLYVVAVIELPPKSVVVIAPVVLFSEQFACEAFVNTLVVSENVIALSELPANVAIVPEKPPAKVPKLPAEVEKVGAADTDIKADEDNTALSDFVGLSFDPRRPYF